MSVRRRTPLVRTRPAFAAFFLVFIVAGSSAAQNADLDDLRKLALQLVNQSRAERKLPPLKLEAKLTQAAQSHADDMLKRNYYSHSSPEGHTVSGRYEAAGGDRWLLTAENIAKCDGCAPPLSKGYVRQMHKGWMNSPGHRANILRNGLVAFGYGITTGKDGRLYAVQTFAGPGTPPDTTGSTADAKSLSREDQAEAALRQINQWRKAAGRTALKLGVSLNSAARSMLPVRNDGNFQIQRVDDIYDALPQGARKDWQSLTLLSAACGGCGVQPVFADIVFFAKQWFGNEKYKAMLLADDITHLGFAIAANGKGKKVSVGLFGKQR